MSAKRATTAAKRGSWGRKTHLAIILPYFCVLPAEDFGVEVAIALCWDGLCVGLAADLNALVGDKGYMLGNERVVEGIEVERRERHGDVRGRERGRHHGRRRQQRAGR